MTLTALELTEIDLDLAALCSRPGCPQDAEVALHLVCGCIVLACIPCREQGRRALAENKGYECLLCRAVAWVWCGVRCPLPRIGLPDLEPRTLKPRCTIATAPWH